MLTLNEDEKPGSSLDAQMDSYRSTHSPASVSLPAQMCSLATRCPELGHSKHHMCAEGSTAGSINDHIQSS